MSTGARDFALFQPVIKRLARDSEDFRHFARAQVIATVPHGHMLEQSAQGVKHDCCFSFPESRVTGCRTRSYLGAVRGSSGPYLNVN